MNTTDKQTFHIPVSFAAFGIADVKAGSFESACQRAIDKEIIPPMFDMDGGYYIEQHPLRDKTALQSWLDAETSGEAKPIGGTGAIRKHSPNLQLQLEHYGVAVTFRLAGVVHIQATTLEEALDIAANDEPLPFYVRPWENPSLVPDAIDHGKQNINLYDYQFITFD